MKINLELSAPSKTFLLGEYAVLNGGPAILMATTPRFKMKVLQAENFSCPDINLASPAGKFLQKYVDDFLGLTIQFIDPYKGIGGFGASSAQFILIYLLRAYLRTNNVHINSEEMLLEYKTLAWNGEGLPPSGADVTAQLHGKICYLNQNCQQFESYTWPFPNLAYCLVHTGNKLATHDHLLSIKYLSTESLSKIVDSARLSLQNKQESQFLERVNDYANLLLEQKLTSSATQTLLANLRQHSDILAAKGCGALGADVILVFAAREKMNQLVTQLKQNNLNVIHYGNEVAQGASLKMINEGIKI